MEQIKEALAAAKNLIPPAEGASDIHVKRWRIWIAAATFLNALGLSAHIALACGFASPFYPGFAQANQLEDVRQDMATVKGDLQAKRLKDLTSLLLDTKQKQCVASGEARRLYFGAYNDLRAEYYSLTKREFPDPPCTDFQ